MQLELRGITKRFGSFTANDQISLKVEPGQIHSLLGENGAGKSTLMNVLFGLLRPDEGEILIDGVVTPINDSGEAVRRGIGMVHQHFMLVPVFTVAENVVLGFEPKKSFDRIDYRAATEDIRRLSQEFHLEVDPGLVQQFIDGQADWPTGSYAQGPTAILSGSGTHHQKNRHLLHGMLDEFCRT